MYENYFSHDSNARNSDKLINVRMKFGAEGYGIFFMILERLREEKEYMSVTDYNAIAFDLRVDSSKVKSIVEDFGLFVFTEDGKYFYSESFLHRMKIKDEKSKKRSIAGKKGADSKWKNQKDGNAIEIDGNAIKNYGNAMAMPSKIMARKEKERKEKETKAQANSQSDDNGHGLSLLCEEKEACADEDCAKVEAYFVQEVKGSPCNAGEQVAIMQALKEFSLKEIKAGIDAVKGRGVSSFKYVLSMLRGQKRDNDTAKRLGVKGKAMPKQALQDDRYTEDDMQALIAKKLAKDRAKMEV